MEASRSLDAQLDVALDELLSLAVLAARAGRPELAFAAGAALDPLLAFLDDDDADGAPADEFFADLAGDRPHAQH